MGRRRPDSGRRPSGGCSKESAVWQSMTAHEARGRSYPGVLAAAVAVEEGNG